MRLTVELVPSPLWGQNLHRVLRPAEWKRLRQKALAAAGGACVICGARGRLNLHEKWQYLDKQGVARLVGLQVLCDLCHAVRHAGLAVEARMYGVQNAERLAQHFCRVNRCDQAAWERHRKAALRRWKKRNQRSWRVDLGRLKGLLPGGPKDDGLGGRLLWRPEWMDRPADVALSFRSWCLAAMEAGGRLPSHKAVEEEAVADFLIHAQSHVADAVATMAKVAGGPVPLSAEPWRQAGLYALDGVRVQMEPAAVTAVERFLAEAGEQVDQIVPAVAAVVRRESRRQAGRAGT